MSTTFLHHLSYITFPQNPETVGIISTLHSFSWRKSEENTAVSPAEHPALFFFRSGIFKRKMRVKKRCCFH